MKQQEIRDPSLIVRCAISRFDLDIIEQVGTNAITVAEIAITVGDHKL